MKKDIVITFIITIIIACVVILYGLSFLTILSLQLGVGSILLILIGVAIIAGLIYAVIHNLKERIQEIKEEDKDDLSQY